jgi:predicted metal-dependent HD superfamily phosphohydrolase
MDLPSRWNALWARLGVGEYPPYNTVRAHYEEQHRHYHTLTHITECLAWHDRFNQPDDIREVAIWLHDVIYDPHAHDNEEKSCGLARQWLQLCSLAPASIEKIEGLILATKHASATTSMEHASMVDIDLAILGATPKRFWVYEAQIRKEYAWVELSLYRSTRAAIMQGFLKRTQIYHSAFMQTLLEEQARFNIQHLIEKLTG